MNGYSLAFILAVMLGFLVTGDISTKWRKDMPDDGEALCALSGEGFRVKNNVWGFSVDRAPELNGLCAKQK